MVEFYFACHTARYTYLLPGTNLPSWLAKMPHKTETFLQWRYLHQGISLALLTLHLSGYDSCLTSGGSKGGREGRAPPSGLKFLHFHAVFGKNWPNNRLAPPLWTWRPLLWEILDPPLLTDIYFMSQGTISALLPFRVSGYHSCFTDITFVRVPFLQYWHTSLPHWLITTDKIYLSVETFQLSI